jgi:tellurite resistance protein TerC
MHEGALFWVVFNALVLLLIVLDLAVFHRKAREIQFGRALLWVLFWVGLAAGFGVWVWRELGHQKMLEFATGYVVEESLSVDNLFIFLLIFRYFKVPEEYQRRVLSWGIVGALLLRGLFIWAGVSLISHFRWIIYVFGAFLVYSGLALIFEGDEKEIHPEKNPVLNLFRRFFPVTRDYEDGKFFVVREAKRWATPLIMVLLFVETTDVIFATDSIPAVLAITPDPFIVYTSNVFAILGLRSLYFLLAGLLGMLRYLHYGIAAILVFVGGKMLVSHFYEIPTAWALAGIAGIIVISAAASLLLPARADNEELTPQ